jgi:hypothetical protein
MVPRRDNDTLQNGIDAHRLSPVAVHGDAPTGVEGVCENNETSPFQTGSELDLSRLGALNNDCSPASVDPDGALDDRFVRRREPLRRKPREYRIFRPD